MYWGIRSIAVFIAFTFILSAHADSIPFSCSTSASQSYGITAQLQRQTVNLSGVVGMNCCATHTFTSDLNNGVMSVIIDNQADCECVDIPCQFSFDIGSGISLVKQVVVKTNFGDILLDTLFVATGIVPRRESSTWERKRDGDLHHEIIDIKGARINKEFSGSTGQGKRPRGVLFVKNHQGAHTLLIMDE